MRMTMMWRSIKLMITALKITMMICRNMKYCMTKTRVTAPLPGALTTMITIIMMYIMTMMYIMMMICTGATMRMKKNHSTGTMTFTSVMRKMMRKATIMNHNHRHHHHQHQYHHQHQHHGKPDRHQHHPQYKENNHHHQHQHHR